MNKIKSGQLFAILLLSGAWSVLCMPQARSGAQLLGICAAAAVQMLLCIPMLLLGRQHFSMFHFVTAHKWLGTVYILFFLLWGAHGFSQLWSVSSEINLPVPGRMTAAVLITIVCLYTCSLGLRTMARCAPLVMTVLLLSAAVMLLGARGRMDLHRLVMETEGVIRSSVSYFAMGGELTAAWILLSSVKTGKKRVLLGYLGAKAALACLILFLCITVGGRMASLSEYPFFTLITLSQPLQSQRADALYILVFVMLYVMHITLQTGVIAHLLHAMFPKLRGAAPLSLGLMLLLSPWADRTGSSVHPLYSTLILITVFIIPLLICLIRRTSHETASAPQNSVPDSAAGGTDDGLH